MLRIHLSSLLVSVTTVPSMYLTGRLEHVSAFLQLSIKSLTAVSLLFLFLILQCLPRHMMSRKLHFPPFVSDPYQSKQSKILGELMFPGTVWIFRVAPLMQMRQNRKARFSKSLSLHLMKITSMLDSIQYSNIIVWVLKWLVG